MTANKKNNTAERQFSHVQAVRVRVSHAARPERLAIAPENFLMLCTDAAQPLCCCLLALVKEIDLTACFYSGNALATAPSLF